MPLLTCNICLTVIGILGGVMGIAVIVDRHSMMVLEDV